MVLGMMIFIISCQDDTQELGRRLDKSEIKFRVEQPLDIDEGGNTVVMINETPGTVAMWDYGTGRSNRMVDTVRFPFKGEYTIQFSALTAGGVVKMDPVIVEVTQDNLMYVNDPLWTALSGGPGEEKSWVLDTEGKAFAGPLSFYGTSNGWLEEGGPWAEGQFETGCYGDDCWTWSPDAAWIYSNNAMAQGDYGVMTFSLEGGPYFSATKPMENGIEEEGTYYLNTDNKTLTINDASILRGYKPGKNGLTGISDWTNYTILALDENTLRLGVIRDKDVDGEGPAMIVYNFISQEYDENWTPEPEGPQEDPNFDFGADQKDILAVDKTTTKVWKLDTQVPFNWTDLEGNFLNEWNSRKDYPSWALYNDAAVENINDASISFSEDGTVVVTQDDGTTAEGRFEIDETTNMVTFTGIKPNILIAKDKQGANGISATTTAQNQWKIVKVDRNEVSGKVTGIWFGARDPELDQYMVYHFKLQVPGGPVELTPEQEVLLVLAGTSEKTWQVDEEVPYNWTGMDGNFKNNWNTRQDIINSGWGAPYGDADVVNVDDASVRFSTDGTVVVTQDDGTIDEGTFTIDGATKTITFSGVTPSIFVAGWVTIQTNPEGNTWKIIRMERNARNEVVGIWFGRPNPDKPTEEYVVYHFVL